MKLLPLITISECMYWRKTVHAQMTMPQVVYLMMFPKNGLTDQNLKTEMSAKI